MLDLLKDFSLDISIILLCLSALILYFGKLIADTRVEKYDRFSLYITGLTFSIPNLLAPFLVSYILIKEISFNFLFLFPIELILIGSLSLNNLYNQYFFRFGWTEELQKTMNEKFEKIKGEKSKRSSLIKKYEPIIEENLGLDYVGFYLKIFKASKYIFQRSYVVFICGCIFTITLLEAFSKGDFITIFIVGITSFYGFTSLAISNGFDKAFYPEAIIVLKDEEELTGRIQKFGDFIYILNDDKEQKLFINKDSIKYIIESKSKSKKPKK